MAAASSAAMAAKTAEVPPVEVESKSGSSDRQTSRSLSMSNVAEVWGDFCKMMSGPGTVLEATEKEEDFYDSLDEVNFEADFDAITRPSSQAILLLDKVTFVAGVVIFWVAAHWIGAAPSTFWKLYDGLAVVLFAGRFLHYRVAKQHYFMFDFCYFANALTMTLLPLIPHPLVHKMLFAFNAGPVAWAIVAMRNSLVFHNWDKLITLFTHWFPAAVAWSVRWHPDCEGLRPCAESPETDPFVKASFWELALFPVIPYAAWLLLYYLKLFVLSEKRIRERGYKTVYGWMVSQKDHPMSRLVMKYPKTLQPVVYLGVHLCCCWACFLLTAVFWHSYIAHTGFLMFISIVSLWNGANFYFEVFAHRYVLGIGMQLKPPKKKVS